MKKLICILISGVLVFGMCGFLAKQPDALENRNGIEAFADKVNRMINDYGNLPQVETYSLNTDFQEYETCRLIVKSEEKLDTLNAVSVISGYKNLWILQFETPYDAAKANEYYSALDCVEYSQPDRPVTMHSIEEDIAWGSKMTRTTEVADFLAAASLEEVKVGIIDSGIDYNNDIFDGRLIDNGVNLSKSGDKTGMSDDPNSHGTHIAGIVAANTLENTKLRAYKIFDSKGSSTELLVITAVDYAVSDGMDIINLSLGTADSNALRECLQNAYDKGTVIVTASGNKGIDCKDILPADFDGAITVGAVDKNGMPTDFSNFGTSLDLVAPGVDIYSCLNGNTYGFVSGTSMATPFVSAASALMLGYAPDMTPAQVEKALKENAHPVNGVYSKTKTGSGILNIAQAMECPRTPESEIILSGTLYNEVTVSFSEAESSATYYTLNGTYPTEENGILYSAPFVIDESCKITWRSFSENGNLFGSKAESKEIRVIAQPDESQFTVDENGVLTAYSGSDTSICVPETVNGITVVSVGDSAFEGTKASFKEILLPDTVKSIGAKAFRTNKTIEYIKGDGLETVGDSAFAECSSFKTLDAPKLKTISDYAFNKCISFSSLNSTEITDIGNYAFAKAEKLEELNTDKLESLGSSSFSNAGIEIFNAPLLKSLNKAAFSDCIYLCKVNLENVETVDVQVFLNCKNLNELYLPNTVTVNENAFKGSGIQNIRFDKLESCKAYFTSDCSVILPSTVTYLGFDSDYILKKVNLRIYSAPGTYAESWAKSRHYYCTVEFISLPAITSSFPEYITDETELSVDAVGFNLTYQWYGSIDGTENSLVLLDGETKKSFNIPDDETYSGYFCKVTSTENGVSVSDTKGAVFSYVIPADYTSYNAAKNAVPSDLSIYTNETVAALNAALSVDVSDKKSAEQNLVDAQTQAILSAISALKIKPADYSAVDAAVMNIPEDLSPYTPNSVEALQTAVNSVDYSLNITMQITVDGYAESISKAIENLEKEGFFTRLFRLIKEFFESLFSF